MVFNWTKSLTAIEAVFQRWFWIVWEMIMAVDSYDFVWLARKRNFGIV